MVKNVTAYRRLLVTLSAAVICSVMLLLSSCSADPAAEQTITSFSELKSAISSANDGDTLYVGDIDFTPSGNAFNSLMRLEINKNITVKSGKRGEKAVFTGGSFILSGGKTNREGISVCFSDVIFDGKTDLSRLTFSDFECEWDEAQGRYTSTEPRKAQYAVSFTGNVNASFEECDFRNYMHEYGPVAHIRYGDYTTRQPLMELFGDYSGCELNLRFSRCNISGNAAGYDGGAIYIEGNNNVTLTAEHCVFSDNRSGGSEYSMGGGAIYVQGAELRMDHCRVENNTANYAYVGMPPPQTDLVRGGGVYVDNASLVMKDSYVVGNTASMGGGIALTNATADIDGCVFTLNRAQTDTESPDGDTGPWTNMAQGGAIYHEGINGAATVIVNSSIYLNSAKTAYGGVYTHFNEAYEETNVSYLELRLCDYAGNTCDAVYDADDPGKIPWCTHPGDIWSIPYLTASGCIVVDDGVTADICRYEIPTAENQYNYFASSEQAAADGVRIAYPEQPAQLSVQTPKDKDFLIPDDFSARLQGGRYAKTVRKLHVGSNYDASLYTEKSSDGILLCISCGTALLLLAFVALYFGRKRMIGARANVRTDVKTEETLQPPMPEADVSETPIQSQPQAIQPQPQAIQPQPQAIQSQPQIVKAWFTAEEIGIIMQSYPRIQTLTARETEVLREILEGKKQKEIAYDLGIEITTVKDFYRKIYDKLDFANKDDLLRNFSGIVAR